MIRPLSIAALLLLAACGDGQPFEFSEEEVTEEDEEEEETGGFDGDGTPPEGTEGPTAGPDESIFRTEAEDGEGGGFVTEVIYNAASDSFTVDNIAFDGDRPYQRQDGFDSLAGYALYASVGTPDDDLVVRDPVIDPRTGETVDQFDYRAIYGVSRDQVRVDGKLEPRSRFAIVRTGSYRNYGFGGFLYERNGGVELPQNGQAVFAGDYAGMRVFSGAGAGAGGLEYTTGDIEIAVDFEDFNSGEGVRGVIDNRQVFDSNGNPLTLGGGDEALVAPTLIFDVGPGALRDNGEIGGTLSSRRVLEDGKVETYESGTYLGIIGGEAEEIVGIVVIDSDDPRFDDVTARETGGFIVYR